MDPIRSLLQPITHNLPSPITNLGTSILGPACYQTLILDIDPTSIPCLKLALSKSLGIGIVTVSSIVKIPQIHKILTSKSGAGISFLSYLLETSAFLVSLAYNVRQGFPFSTYGEGVFILVQNVVICVLVLGYAGRQGAAALFVAGLAVAAGSLLVEGVVDGKVLSLLQIGAGMLGLASKVPQIAAIWSEGGTGQLSAFAVFNYLAGSLTRIFTTLQEVDDKIILSTCIAGFTLNAIIAAQMAYYWNTPAQEAGMKQKVKEKDIVSSVASTSGSATSTPKSKQPTTRRRG